jgi:ankyrin repeat protein
MAGVGAAAGAAGAAATRRALSRQLMDAARAGRAFECTQLIERKADVHSRGLERTALSTAAYRSHHDVCLLLLDAKATITARAFGNAAYADNMETCRTFLEAKADVNAPDWNGVTPIMRAAKKNRVSVCALLLAAHANPHWQATCNGYTALHSAARWGARDVCVLLLQTVAAPLLLLDVKNDYKGDTALQIATKEQHATTAQLLRDWRGCAAFDAQTRAKWMAPRLPTKGQAYSWAQSRLFDVHLIKEITSFLL